MKSIKIRKPYYRERLTILNDEASMTHESHAASCDINNIVAQFHRTGQMPPGRGEPQYADTTNINTDLTVAHLNAVDIIQKTEEFTKNYVPKSKRKPTKQKDDSDDSPPKKTDAPTGQIDPETD